MAALAGKQDLVEGKNAKPDFLDVDKDGNKKESFKQAVKDKELDEASYSAKAARAGKDIGKPGKAFSKIAKDAAERYGSKERGEKVAGAVLAKLRAKTNEASSDVAKLSQIAGKCAKHAGFDTDRQDYLKAKALFDAGKESEGFDVIYDMDTQARDDFFDLCDDAGIQYSMDEGNEFSGELAKAKASGAKSFEVDGKEYPVKEDKKKNAFDPEVAKSMFAPEKGKTKTGHDVKDTGYSKRYTKKLNDEPEDSDDDTPKTKGRKAVGAGKGKKIGAKVRGTSKLHKKGAIAECGDDPEYGQEGDMAKDDLKSAVLAAKELHSILGDNEDLPEWVQSKITKALDYLNASNQYMQRAHDDMDDEVVAEKAVSQQQQKFMGMAHAMQKGEKIKGASPELKKVAKTMKKSDVKDFAATKHEGLPKKVKEADAEPKAKKSGGMEFGKGVYEAMNDNLESLITESMNVNVSMSTNDAGEPTKSITVSAEGEQAEMLAQLLNLAGLQGHGQACSTCGSTPCGCEQQVDEVDENNPDWPTDAETTGEDDPNLTRWAGGLNKPKETGQTTTPVVNRDPARGSVGPKEMAENVDLGLNLYAELKSFKAK